MRALQIGRPPEAQSRCAMSTASCSAVSSMPSTIAAKRPAATSSSGRYSVAARVDRQARQDGAEADLRLAAQHRGAKGLEVVPIGEDLQRLEDLVAARRVDPVALQQAKPAILLHRRRLWSWSCPHQTGHAAWVADCETMNSRGERMRKPL